MPVRVQSTDVLSEAYRARVKSLGERKLSIGIHAAEGDKTDGDSTRSVLEVAIWNEFGTSRIPSRSFLRGWFDENEAQIYGKWGSICAKGLDKDVAMEQFASGAVGQIQVRVSNRIPPANAPSTLRQKAPKDVPLIRTGQLRSSITHAVT